MTKVSFSYSILIVPLFILMSCGDNPSDQQHHTPDTLTKDSVGVSVSDSNIEITPKLQGVTVEQRDLNQLFKAISSKELTEEEQKELIEHYKDSINN